MLGPVLETHWAQMLGLSVGIQIVAWSVAVFFQTEKFYDLVGKDMFNYFVLNKLFTTLYSFVGNI